MTAAPGGDAPGCGFQFRGPKGGRAGPDRATLMGEERVKERDVFFRRHFGGVVATLVLAELRSILVFENI